MTLFHNRGQAPCAKKISFLYHLAPFKVRAKKFDLYFCQEKVFPQAIEGYTVVKCS